MFVNILAGSMIGYYCLVVVTISYIKTANCARRLGRGVDQGFDSELIALRLPATQYIWNDKGSGSHVDGEFRRVHAPDNYYLVGDYGQSHYGASSGKVLALRAITDTALKRPVDFTRVWRDYGAGANDDGSFWMPVCEDGYTAVGTIAQSGYNKPNPAKFRCVRSDLTVQGKVGKLIWSDRGSGAHGDFSAWTVEGTSDCTLTGTFIGHNSHSKPSFTMAKCLKTSKLFL